MSAAAQGPGKLERTALVWLASPCRTLRVPVTPPQEHLVCNFITALSHTYASVRDALPSPCWRISVLYSGVHLRRGPASHTVYPQFTSQRV